MANAQLNVAGQTRFFLNLSGRRIALPTSLNDTLLASLSVTNVTGLPSSLLTNDALEGVLSLIPSSGLQAIVLTTDIIRGILSDVSSTGLQGVISTSGRDEIQGLLSSIFASGLGSSISSSDVLSGLLSGIGVDGLLGSIVTSDRILASLGVAQVTGLEARILATDVMQGLLSAVGVSGIEASIEVITFGQLTTDLVYLYDHATTDASTSYDAWASNHLGINETPTFASSGQSFGNYVEVSTQGVEGAGDFLSMETTDPNYSGLAPGTSDVTLSQWFYINSFVNGFQSLSVMGAGGASDPGFACTVRNTGDLWFMFADGSIRPQRSVSGVSATTWTHQFSSVDRDGNLVVKRDLSNTSQTSAAGTNGVNIVPLTRFAIGTEFQEIADNRQAQSMYHKRLLTSAEESYIYNSGAGRSTAEILTVTGL